MTSGQASQPVAEPGLSHRLSGRARVSLPILHRTTSTSHTYTFILRKVTGIAGRLVLLSIVITILRGIHGPMISSKFYFNSIVTLDYA